MAGDRFADHCIGMRIPASWTRFPHRGDERFADRVTGCTEVMNATGEANLRVTWTYSNRPSRRDSTMRISTSANSKGSLR
jgi:hypothetical protein